MHACSIRHGPHDHQAAGAAAEVRPRMSTAAHACRHVRTGADRARAHDPGLGAAGPHRAHPGGRCQGGSAHPVPHPPGPLRLDAGIRAVQVCPSPSTCLRARVLMLRSARIHTPRALNGMHYREKRLNCLRPLPCRIRLPGEEPSFAFAYRQKRGRGRMDHSMRCRTRHQRFVHQSPQVTLERGEHLSPGGRRCAMRAVAAARCMHAGS